MSIITYVYYNILQKKKETRICIICFLIFFCIYIHIYLFKYFIYDDILRIVIYSVPDNLRDNYK